MPRLYIGLVGVALICWGAVEIFSPATLEKLTLRLSGLTKMLIPRTPKQSLILSRRLVGVLAFATGAYILQLALRHHFIPYQPHAVPRPQGGPDWQSLAFSFAGAAFGLSLILRPRIFRDMIEKNFPTHKLAPETSGSTAITARLIGALFVSIETYHIYLWFKSNR